MIDTLSIARNLAAAGFDQKQAEAQAEAIANAVEQKQGETATKEFVRGEITALEVRLVRWIIGAGFVYTGLLFAVIRFTFSP